MTARESPARKTGPVPLHEALHLFKRQLVVETLASHEGNRTRAAVALMIERTSLLRLIRELGITELPDGETVSQMSLCGLRLRILTVTSDFHDSPR